VDYGSLGVDSSSFIGDISNISLIAISLVVNMLDTAVRKSHRVGSRSIASTITSLSSIESSLGVVISNSVGVGVGRRLIRVGWLSIALHHRGMVGRGSMHHRSVVGRSSMHNRSVVGRSCVDNRGVVSGSCVDNRGMVDNWGSMDSMNKGSMMDNRSMNSMVDAVMSNWDDGSMSNSNRPVSTNSRLDLRKTLGVVYLRDGGVGSSKSLGLDNTSLFSIRPGH